MNVSTTPINNGIYNEIKYEKTYNGSNICLLSSHLFLLSSLFNYYHNNIIESFSIFSLYITSIFYHYYGEKTACLFNMFNIDYKLLDVYCCHIVIFICSILSLMKYNMYPTLATIFIIIMYNNKISYTNTLHAILVHLPGALGFISIYYNNTNNNNIYSLQTLSSQIFIIWIPLVIICCMYLIYYYEFYLSYKIKVLNLNIKNLKLEFIKNIDNIDNIKHIKNLE